MMRCSECRKSIFKKAWVIFLKCCKRKYGDLRILCTTCGSLQIPSLQTARVLGIVDALALYIFAFIGVLYRKVIRFSPPPVFHQMVQIILLWLLVFCCWSAIKSALLLLLSWHAVLDESMQIELRLFDKTYRDSFRKATGFLIVFVLILWLIYIVIW